MSSILQFDFVVDKDARTIHVTREFAAQPSLVWDAWTKPEILDKWWAPAPYQNQTKFMDFSPGGRWHYAMLGPQGDKHWALFDYHTINAITRFTATDAFCNEQGEIFASTPQSEWSATFTPSAQGTVVHIVLTFAALEDLEAIIKMGFKEGFTAGLDQLDAVLKAS